MCTGTAHLEASEKAEALTVLAEDADEIIREHAQNALLSQPIEGFVSALQGDVPFPQLFIYCGRHLIEKPEIAAAMALNRYCPAQFFPAAAKYLPTSAVQDLMEDLDRLSVTPGLVAALMHSTSLTADQRQQLEELVRNTTEKAEVFAEAAAEAEPDPERRVTLLQRLSQMRVVERVQLALKGNREERMALIRDSCKVVQRAVLQSARLTDREVESFAGMTNMTDEILRLIGTNRKFRRNYSVLRNLMFNPKTPIDVTLHMLTSVNPQDLKSLAANKNVPETLRTSAARLQQQRNKARSGE